MSNTGTTRTVWRVTLETASCFTIGTGGGDDVRDSVCVTDANGFPTIPGTSIAGVLRSAIAVTNPERAQAIFGFVDGDRGQASRLEVSWAQVHDEKNRVVPLRRPGGDHPADPVLELLATGVTRDHVRLNSDGAVDGRGKFDETLVPVGARFTFELQLVDGTPAEEQAIVDALSSGLLRFGGRTRMGHGRMKLVTLRGRRFALKDPKERDAWLALPVPLEVKDNLPAWPERPDAPLAAHQTAFRVELLPEDFWLVGGGEPLQRFTRAGRPSDIVPVTQRVIRWANDKASIANTDSEDQLEALLPATTVKGAIRHRFLYLARCAALARQGERDADAMTEELFGTIKDDGTDARPGAVFFSDARVQLERDGDGALDHVCIDRFTGGPMNGMLFSEAPRFRTRTKLVIDVLVDRRRVSGEAWRILKEAIDDLRQGRLALGGGSNRGHGYFRGEVVVRGDGRWENA